MARSEARTVLENDVRVTNVLVGDNIVSATTRTGDTAGAPVATSPHCQCPSTVNTVRPAAHLHLVA